MPDIDLDEGGAKGGKTATATIIETILKRSRKSGLKLVPTHLRTSICCRFFPSEERKLSSRILFEFLFRIIFCLIDQNSESISLLSARSCFFCLNCAAVRLPYLGARCLCAQNCIPRSVYLRILFNFTEQLGSLRHIRSRFSVFGTSGAVRRSRIGALQMNAPQYPQITPEIGSSSAGRHSVARKWKRLI